MKRELKDPRKPKPGEKRPPIARPIPMKRELKAGIKPEIWVGIDGSQGPSR